jgi:hypothetical protein
MNQNQIKLFLLVLLFTCSTRNSSKKLERDGDTDDPSVVRPESIDDNRFCRQRSMLRPKSIDIRLEVVDENPLGEYFIDILSLPVGENIVGDRTSKCDEMSKYGETTRLGEGTT